MEVKSWQPVIGSKTACIAPRWWWGILVFQTWEEVRGTTKLAFVKNSGLSLAEAGKPPWGTKQSDGMGEEVAV